MAHEEPQRSQGLTWPCFVNVPAARKETGGLRGRLARSWTLARQTWRDHPALLRSLLRWGALGVLLATAATAVLARGSTLPNTLVAGAIQASWMAWWLFFIALHVGLVRPAQGPHHTKIGLPNGLSVSRILLIPTLAWTVLAYARLREHGALATSLIFLLGFSDVLDGWLARLTHWQTLLGRNLDHGADVLICSALALAEHQAGLLPGWLLALYLIRYLGAGAVGLYGLASRPDLHITPSFIGRITTLVAGMALFFTIAQPLVAPTVSAPMVWVHRTAALFIVVNCVALAGMAWTGRAFEHRDRGPTRPSAGKQA